MKKEEQDPNSAKKSEKIGEPKAKSKHHVRGIWAVTLILVLSALLVTAVWIFVISNSNDEISSFLNINRDKKAQEEQKKEEEANKGLKEYVNLSALFLFDYPNTWTLTEQNNEIIISSDSVYPKAYFAGQGPEMKDTDIYVQIHFSNLTIDISREAPAIKPKFSNLNVGGVATKRVTYKNEDIYSDIIQNFQAGDFYFLIIADTKSKNTDKIDAYNKMLASFKFGKDAAGAAKNK